PGYPGCADVFDFYADFRSADGSRFGYRRSGTDYGSVVDSDPDFAADSDPDLAAEVVVVVVVVPGAEFASAEIGFEQVPAVAVAAQACFAAVFVPVSEACSDPFSEVFVLMLPAVFPL